MIDIKLLRENPNLVKDSLKRRKEKQDIVDQILNLDQDWRENFHNINLLKHEKNKKSEEINKKKKNGEDASEIIKELKTVSKKLVEKEKLVQELKSKRDKLLWSLPNILHESVPDGTDENDNVPIRFHGKAKVFKEHLNEFKEESKNQMDYEVFEKAFKSHVDILTNSKKADFLNAAKIAGSRFYILKDEFVLLNLALQRFALDFLKKKDFIPLLPPFMLNRKAYEGVTDLEAFNDTLYKIEGEDLYLIATSEHPMAAMYMNSILEEKELPLKFAGISPCFRKEAGSHGKDTKGIFRVHQFFKIEQFIYSKPENSWNLHEELIKNSEEMFQKLEIPYRIVNICAGDMGAVASKKYDLEAWMPVQGKFREMVSASNVLDYQTRRLNIKMRSKNDFIYPHTLNSTGLAISRTITAIIENLQTENSVQIPKALHKYLDFKEIFF